ncbi:hypothetical protein T492DRAFT_1036054 [Pavlovales sp. CCMP2436]|nr:hypothetical protein T492DRAFT_1036054 [Pavlovales sp. CCMP2436]
MTLICSRTAAVAAAFAPPAAAALTPPAAFAPPLPLPPAAARAPLPPADEPPPPGVADFLDFPAERAADPAERAAAAVRGGAVSRAELFRAEEPCTFGAAAPGDSLARAGTGDFDKGDFGAGGFGAGGFGAGGFGAGGGSAGCRRLAHERVPSSIPCSQPIGRAERQLRWAGSF